MYLQRNQRREKEAETREKGDGKREGVGGYTLQWSDNSYSHAIELRTPRKVL